MTKKELNIEDLAKDFEERIINNEFYEDTSFEYRNSIIECRIRPIPQKEFSNIVKNNKLKETSDLMEFQKDIVCYALLNRNDNEPFDKEKISSIFPMGLIKEISEKVLLISGLITEEQKNEFELFLK